MKKILTLVPLLLCMVFISACSTATNSSDTSLSEASIISDTDQDASSDTDNASNGGACSSYDSEMLFSTYAELETYVLENKILSEKGRIFNLISPYNGEEAFSITFHGNWIYFDFCDNPLLSIGYNYTGNGEKGLKSFVKNNEGVVFPYEKVEGMYYSTALDEANNILSYVLYWAYDGFYFYAPVPEEILDIVVENIVAGKYIR